MSTISFSQLESARKNPSAFAKNIGKGGSSSRFSKYMAWQLSIHEYHKHSEDLAKSINYFEMTFIRNFADNPKNAAERAQWIQEIEAYSKNDIALKLTHVESKKRVSIQLATKVTFGGQLPLIKMNNKGGYSVFFFSRESATWEEELRFPIIQNYVAQTLYNVDLSEIEVGIYSLDFQKHLSKIYSSKDVKEAIKELNAIGKAVSKVLAP